MFCFNALKVSFGSFMAAISSSSSCFVDDVLECVSGGADDAAE